MKISIIGLGYVGLPLAVEFGKKYDVLGFDINKERIAELENDNKNFKKTASDRVDESSVKTQLKMKEVRTKVDEAYKVITKRIDALIELNGETDYKTFVTKLNIITDKYNQTLAIRRGRNKGGDDTTTEQI